MPRVSTIDRLRGLPPLRALALLFLPIAAIRIAMVLLFAPAIPYFDEWDGVILGMAKPLLRGAFDLGFLLTSENGHPLFLTKLISLAFLQAQGLRFDNVPVCVFNQLFHALAVALLMIGAVARLGANAAPFLLLAALLLIAPFDWENITMGWGNAYPMTSAFGVGLIVVCVFCGAGLRSAAAIVLLGGAAASCLGSGPVAPLIGCTIIAWRVAQREVPAARAVFFCAALLAWSALAFAIGRTSSIDVGLDELGPIQCVELALLIACWLPTWLHASNFFIRGERSAFDLVVIATGIWGFVQIAAMILLRPSHFRLWLPISRYMDIIAVGVLAEMASLCRIADGPRERSFGLDRAAARRALVAAIVAVLLASPLAFYCQIRAGADHRSQARVIADYLASRDPRILRDAPASSLAYPWRDHFREMLDDPDVERVISEAVARSR